MIKQLSLKKQAPDVATLEGLKTLEAKLNFQFPPAFVEFCTRWNGGFPSMDNNFYPVSPEFNDYHDQYKGSTGVYVDRLLGATEEFWQCSLLKECLALGEFARMYISITIDFFGNSAVLRADSPTEVVFWADHELWDSDGRPYLIPIAQNLESFYNSLTTVPYR